MWPDCVPIYGGVMARSEQFTLKIRLSRSERRELTRGMKAAKASTLSGYVRSLALEAARGVEAVPLVRPAKPPEATQRSNGGVSAKPLRNVPDWAPPLPAASPTLVRSYDPDPPLSP